MEIQRQKYTAIMCLKQEKNSRKMLFIKDEQGRWIIPYGQVISEDNFLDAAKRISLEKIGYNVDGKINKKKYHKFTFESEQKQYEFCAYIIVDNNCNIQIHNDDIDLEQETFQKWFDIDTLPFNETLFEEMKWEFSYQTQQMVKHIRRKQHQNYYFKKYVKTNNNQIDSNKVRPRIDFSNAIMHIQVQQ